MTPATGSDAQAVLDAVAAGDPIPSGFGFDGVNAVVIEPSDEERIEAGGPVEPPPDPADLNAAQPPVVTPETDGVGPQVGDPV